ncbi:MAG: ComF family protein [Gammaproteobacteria bacterium]
MSWVRVDEILDLVFTPRCVLCGQTVAGSHRPACPGCLADLPWLDDAGIALPWPAASPATISPGSGPKAAAAVATNPQLHALSALSYEYPVDRLVAQAKFGRRIPVARALGELMALRLPAPGVVPDAVVPVPLHWRRESGRGFNQAEEIARALCEARGWPLRTDLCRRLRSTPEQSGLSAEARRVNLRDAFGLRNKALEACFRHVLVVDDVLTTGATGLAVASLFRAAGAVEISFWTVARTPPPG